MQKKKIMVIAHYMRMPWEKGNSRFLYLISLLNKQEYEVELLTSSFSHSNKCQKEKDYDYIKKLDYKLTILYEPGYKKNVSLRRFYSHHILGRNLKKYLKGLKTKPDIIYCAVPSLDIGKEAAKLAKKYNIRFIIDVQDLWPEAFKMVFNIPILSDILFYPMKKTADFIYKTADDIVAAADTYANRVARVNKKYKTKESVFLGTELSYFDECKKNNEIIYEDDTVRLVYIGTLGHSYDLQCIMDALEILKNQGISNILFLIMGSGPLKEVFENYAKNKSLNCEFIGGLDYDKMVGELCACDIAVNPIKSKSAGSIINKVGDYAAAGLPVINTQECKEYRDLVRRYKIGFNCENGNPVDIAEKIGILYRDEKLRKELGKNNRILAEEKFDRKKTYKKIVNLVEKDDRNN